MTNFYILILSAILSLEQSVPSCEIDPDIFRQNFIGNISDIENIKGNLVRIQGAHLFNWLTTTDRGLIGEAFYLNQFKNHPNIVSIYYSGDDYTGIRLLSLNNDCIIAGQTEIAGGHCSGPFVDEATGLVVWCNQKESKLLDIDRIEIKLIKNTSEGYNEGSKQYIDTLTYHLNLADEHLFDLELIDSVRYVSKI